MGASDEPKKDTLFHAYHSFCSDEEFEKANKHKFGERIVSLLQSLQVPVEMKRRSKGMVVTGVEIGGNNLIRPQPTPYVDEIKGLDPFSGSL